MKKKELEQVRGWMFTHYDCPHCDNVIEKEGDPKGEIIECDVCEYKFIGD